MINETNKMREARHELQTLSASDPLAQANLLRHVAACTQFLTGRPGVEALPGEPLVGAGFRLVDGEEKLLAALTRRDGLERIYLAFNIDDAQGPPIGPAFSARRTTTSSATDCASSGRRLVTAAPCSCPPGTVSTRDTSHSAAASRSAGSRGRSTATSPQACAARRPASLAS